MKTSDPMPKIDPDAAGRGMYDLITRLYPLCRSITGEGFRKTLRIIKEYIPLSICEVASGTPVFDWNVPKEWNIEDAFIKNSQGERVVDFRQSNLHVVGYSIPIRAHLSLAELTPHLHTLPEHPDWIPYRTSYYRDDWGFCLAHNEFTNLKEDTYEAYIDSTLTNGHLTYGEYFRKGQSPDEVLISCHACHPSLCNDNLSGVALVTELVKYLEGLSPRYSYRIILIPGTIGSITWLALNEKRCPRIKHGLVVACVGDPGPSTYKKSRRGNAEIDQAVEWVLHHSGKPFKVEEFSPYGYDERQYCSPGFNLPVGSLQRTPHGQYPQYHTSADDLDFIAPQHLADSLQKYVAVLNVLENNLTYRNTNPKCEPQLGKRGLYQAIGGKSHQIDFQMALLWVLNLSDGRHALLDIAKRSGLRFESIKIAADALVQHGLLEHGRD